MRQSRMCFSSSCPKPFLFFQKAARIIRTLLYLCTYPSPELSSTPVWPWLPETQRDPSHMEARNHAGAAAGLRFEGQGAHSGQWGYTNMQSIYFWGFFSFVLWFIFFLSSHCKHCFGCQHERRDRHSRTRGNYAINTIQANVKKN